MEEFQDKIGRDSGSPHETPWEGKWLTALGFSIISSMTARFLVLSVPGSHRKTNDGEPLGGYPIPNVILY